MTIPVAETARASYSFVAAHILTLLRLTWLPLVINSLAGTMTALKLAPFLPSLQSGDSSKVVAAFNGSVLGWILLLVGVVLATSGVVAVAILRYVVRGDAGTSRLPVHVSFGWPELRIIAVTFLIAVMMVLLSVPISLVFSVLSSITGSPALLALAPLVASAAMIVIAARWLMAYPVAALEDRISFDRAWSLMRPSYTRFLMLMAVVLVPLFLLSAITSGLIAPSETIVDPVAFGKEIESKWILMTAVDFVGSFLGASVFFSTLGIVYKNVSSGREANGVRKTS